MSWPSDGEPRFIVREVTGYVVSVGTTPGNAIARTSVMVRDRAFAHRCVYASPARHGYRLTLARAVVAEQAALMEERHRAALPL